MLPQAALPTLLTLFSLGHAQTQSITPNVCSPPPVPEAKTAQERQRRAEWAKYRALLPVYAAKLPSTPDAKLLMPVRGVAVRSVADTFGAPRSGERSHEGQDIFAPKGTPVYSATQGFVWRIGVNTLGGNYVFIAGPGGRHYYYAHLDRWAKGLQEGQKVTTGTLLGYVGNTGNARTTPSHLHFGVYSGSRASCDRKVIDPLPLLVDRDWRGLASSAAGKSQN